MGKKVFAIISGMAGKDLKKVNKTSIRFGEDDRRDLARCQEVLGGLSQSDTIRMLMKLFLGKIPNIKR